MVLMYSVQELKGNEATCMNLQEPGIFLFPPRHGSCGNMPLQVVRRLQLKHGDHCSNGHIWPPHFSAALLPASEKFSGFSSVWFLLRM